MVEVEFQVLADQREGLLLQLGQAVIAAGFTLMRQRLAETSEGVRLTLVVRGPQAQLLALEERLGTHRLVRSFEAIAHEEAQVNGAVSNFAPPETTFARAPNPDPGVVRVSHTALDMRRIEPELRLLAQDYPNVFPRLLSLERSFDPESKDASMRYLGQRVGAWIYKRDFSLGARLVPADALKHVAVQALRPLVQAEAHADELRIRNSPFVVGGHGRAHSCHFFSGYLEALLKEAGGNNGSVVVRETYCRSTGADACVFEIHA